MMDIDSSADIGLSYHDAELHITIPLAEQVNEMCCRRYEALARTMGVQATVRGTSNDPVQLFLAVSAKANDTEVRAIPNTARRLIAEGRCSQPDTGGPFENRGNGCQSITQSVRIRGQVGIEVFKDPLYPERVGRSTK
jgi:hypothetical protein